MKSETLKLGRLKKRAEFLYVREGKSLARPGLVIQFRKNPQNSESIRVGFTATRKIGNAVQRNRAKRRLRALAQELVPLYGRTGVDYVFIARAKTSTLPWENLRKDAIALLQKGAKNLFPVRGKSL